MTGLDQITEGLRSLVSGLVRDEVKRALADATKPDEHLSTKAAAKYAGVHVDTVRRWIREGKIESHRAGRAVRVRRTDLEALLAAEPAPIVRTGPRAELGRFAPGERTRRSRSAPRADDVSPEELAMRDFG